MKRSSLFFTAVLLMVLTMAGADASAQGTDSAWVMPSSIYVNADTGSTVPISVPVLLMSTLDPTPYDSYLMGGPSSFVSVDPPSGVTMDSLRIVIDPAGLDVGYHDDTVVFEVEGITDPVLLGVCLYIVPAPPDSAWVVPSSIYVNADTGSTVPISVPVLLMSTLDPTPYDSYLMGGPSSFVSVDPPSGVTMDSLRIVIDPTGLEMGYHNDTVVFEVDGITDPVLLGVTLEILSEPTADSVWLSDTHQYFFAPEGVDLLQYGGVMVYSSGPSVPFTVGILDDRDMVYLLDTESATNDLIAFEVRSTADMPAGLYVDTLLFTFEGDFSPEILVAFLHIDSGGSVGDSAWVIPHSIYVTAEVGSTEPILWDVGVFSSNAPAAFDVTVLGGPSSFVSVPIFVVPPETNTYIPITINPSGLEVGYHSDTVVFDVDGVDYPVSLAVTLEITSEPTIDSAWVEPSYLSFTFPLGTRSPELDTVFIYSTNAPAPYSCYVLGGPLSFVSIADTAGFTDDSVLIAIDPSDLDVGLYYDTVEFYVTGCGEYPWVAVTVEITAGTDSTQRRVRNHPNPFNPWTTVSFGLEKATHVELTVYDILGRKVKCLHSGPLPAGDHQVVWDGTDSRGEQVCSGVYFCRLETGEQIRTHKMTLIK